MSEYVADVVALGVIAGLHVLYFGFIRPRPTRRPQEVDDE